MIRKPAIYNLFAATCILAGFLIAPVQAGAQFIDLRLDIDSELTATTERALEFGTVSSNSHRMIELGSTKMGIFSITGLEGQQLLINLHKPNKLYHSDPAVKDTIPIKLFAQYGYSTQDYQDSIPLQTEINTIKLESNPNPSPWNTIYIFMYGSVTIGNIVNGIYSNQIILSVEYI